MNIIMAEREGVVLPPNEEPDKNHDENPNAGLNPGPNQNHPPPPNPFCLMLLWHQQNPLDHN